MEIIVAEAEEMDVTVEAASKRVEIDDTAMVAIEKRAEVVVKGAMVAVGAIAIEDVAVMKSDAPPSCRDVVREVRSRSGGYIYSHLWVSLSGRKAAVLVMQASRLRSGRIAGPVEHDVDGAK